MWDSEASRIGKRLYSEGLVLANFGNLSVRDVSGFFIKRRNASLDEPGFLVFVPFEGPIPSDASRESIVHREIYRKTSAGAVIHAHPPHAIALSYHGDEVKPCDSKGEMLCPIIRVVEGASGTPELAHVVADALCTSSAVIVQGHGTFVIGATLEEAYILTSAIEHACHILILRQIIRKEP